jgi:hypothetical protein
MYTNFRLAPWARHQHNERRPKLRRNSHDEKKNLPMTGFSALFGSDWRDATLIFTNQHVPTKSVLHTCL